MPIEFEIDHARRLVRAKAVGNLTAEDLFKYQHQVWSLPEVRGYNEIVDMTDIREIVSPSHEKLVQLSRFSAQMDDRNTPAKFAIVASDTFAYGLAQLYESYRNLNPRSTKNVCVFRTLQDAQDWIERQ